MELEEEIRGKLRESKRIGSPGPVFRRNAIFKKNRRSLKWFPITKSPRLKIERRMRYHEHSQGWDVTARGRNNMDASSGNEGRGRPSRLVTSKNDDGVVGPTGPKKGSALEGYRRRLILDNSEEEGNPMPAVVRTLHRDQVKERNGGQRLVKMSTKGNLGLEQPHPPSSSSLHQGNKLVIHDGENQDILVPSPPMRAEAKLPSSGVENLEDSANSSSEEDAAFFELKCRSPKPPCVKPLRSLKGRVGKVVAPFELGLAINYGVIGGRLEKQLAPEDVAQMREWEEEEAGEPPQFNEYGTNLLDPYIGGVSAR
ncbi:unnamed protein product [Linum trigynum]|uniref:Uncharacterized protein n=1 Tax=Linum trigynum TaxID=586398 RepID=A0AAV2G8F6_9ROSI